MANALDTFIERGNTQSEPTIGDTFTWQGSDYIGTVSDINRDEFFSDDGAGRKKNAERTLEAALSVFPTATRPAINDTITYDGTEYFVTEVTSLDTTNVEYTIREKIGQS